MTFNNLKIIGERINPGFKSSKELIDNEDVEKLQGLAVDQVNKGASFININVGTKALEKPEFMVEVIKAVQNKVSVPIAFDFPNLEVQEACLKAYDLRKSNGGRPIINSISELRWEMLDLLKIMPCQFILMASEREVGGKSIANKTALEVFETTKRMRNKILGASDALSNDDLFVDVSIGPIGADIEGLTRMAVDAIRMIGSDRQLKGIHMSVGLSNISIMLPSKASDGSMLKAQIESAFLSLTVPYGLDTILGTAGRDYQMLDENNLVMKGVKESLDMGGFDSIMRIQQIYQG